MANDALNIVIGGEAGQGLATVGELLSKTLVRAGYSINVTQDYQNRVRGGHNTFRVRASPNQVLAPQESVDLLVALTADTVDLHKQEMAPRGLMLADQSLKLEGCCLNVPFSELAEGRFVNVAALGVIGGLLGLDRRVALGLVKDNFSRMGPEVVQTNRQALDAGYKWAQGQKSPLRKLSRVTDRPKRLMLNGNEALVLGALSAGLRFYSFYPMTPSTPIGLNLAAYAEKMGLVVEQGEDEIAVINMALGASFAGAPAMVGTSGGGFALMVESVSLAGMSETPIVIVVGQRPGPATGLPTRTEQGELEFVLHSGHGEFPRAILTPGNAEQCFHLARKALELAERYQTPIFILTDLYLADCYQDVIPFEIESLPQYGPQIDQEPISRPYARYAITENGISPRLLPGLSEHLVVADSDEHDEAGHLTEDLSLRTKMVEKRLRKGEGIREEVVPPDYEGEDSPDILLVSWGSTRGSTLEAAAVLREQGVKAATLHFSQVWPLVQEQFIDKLKAAKQVVSIESNAFGQFARLIRRETGFHIRKQVHRYDGLPITPEYILRNLGKQGIGR